MLVLKSLTRGLFCSTMMHSTYRQGELEILDVFMEPQTQYVQKSLPFEKTNKNLVPIQCPLSLVSDTSSSLRKTEVILTESFLYPHTQSSNNCINYSLQIQCLPISSLLSKPPATTLDPRPPPSHRYTTKMTFHLILCSL